MSIKSINVLSDSLSQDIIDDMTSDFFMNVSYDINGKLIGGFKHAFNYVGLYGFVLEKQSVRGVAYVGKTESDNRLMQHITEKTRMGHR